MKTITTLLISFLTVLYSIGQTVDYDKIIPPQESINLPFSEKLVQLSWQNQPAVEILYHQLEISKQDQIKAKSAWFDYLNLSLNANEFTLGLRQNKTVDASGNTVNSGNPYFPIFNAGLSLKINALAYIPAEKKKASEQIKINEANIKDRKLILRSLVLNNYQQYVTAKELLAIQIESTEDASAINDLSKQKFKDGKISLDELNNVANNYIEQKSKLITMDGRVVLIKISLEQLIGIKLEDVK